MKMNKRMALGCPGLVVCTVFFAAAAQAQDVSFLPPQSYPVGISPVFVAVGDFNGDGRLDLVVANAGSRSVSVLLGNGDGTFQAARHFETWTFPTSVAIGDFNGDGRQDLVVSNYWKNISVLLGNGDGTFQAARKLAAGGSPYFIAVGDFNGDGRQDLAVSTHGIYPFYRDAVGVFLGNGDGTFQEARDFGGVKNPSSLAVGDFNGDGVQDLAVADFVFTSENVSVLLGNGDGSFEAVQNTGAGHSPNSVAVGDFNGDGWQDLAVSNAYSANVSVLLGNGDGSFQAARNLRLGFQPLSVAVGDFNGDGRLDVVVTNDHFDHVSVLINDTPWPDHKDDHP
jgi:hypothetical protein